MGWPKGMPRKGHINKNGTTHAKWGKKAARSSFKVSHPAQTEYRVLGPTTSASDAAARDAIDAAKKRRGRPPKDPNQKKWDTKLTNKGLDKCPKCEFPEAYGGYCPECGWMEPLLDKNGNPWVPSTPRARKANA